MRNRIQPYNPQQGMMQAPPAAPTFSPEQAQYLDYLDKTGQINLQPQQPAQYPQHYAQPEYPATGFTTQHAMQMMNASGGRPVQVEIYEGIRFGQPASYHAERHSNETFLKVIVLLVFLLIGIFGIFGGLGGIGLLGGILS